MNDMALSTGFLDSHFRVKEAVKARIVVADSKGTFTSPSKWSFSRGATEWSTLPISSIPVSEYRAKLRMKWSVALVKASELEKIYPDPVQAMINLLGSIPGDYNTWREIIEEPYG
jgi:hypothetical protein